MHKNRIAMVLSFVSCTSVYGAEATQDKSDCFTHVRWGFGHRKPVMSVDWSPDGNFIASSSGDRTVKVWDPKTGEAVRTHRGHKGLVWDSVWLTDERLASCSDDKTIRVWNAHKRNFFPPKLRGHDAHVLCLAYSHGKLTSGSADNTVRVWDAGTGTQVRKFDDHKDWIFVVDMSSDGSQLASGSWDKTVCVYDLRTAKKTRTITDDFEVNALAFSQDGGQLAASSGKNVKIYDTGTHRGLQVLNGHQDWVRSVAWLSENCLASSSDDQSVKIWNTQEGTIVPSVLACHGGRVYTVAGSSDGLHCATGSEDATVGILARRQLQ